MLTVKSKTKYYIYNEKLYKLHIYIKVLNTLPSNVTFRLACSILIVLDWCHTINFNFNQITPNCKELFQKYCKNGPESKGFAIKKWNIHIGNRHTQKTERLSDDENEIALSSFMDNTFNEGHCHISLSLFYNINEIS